MRNALVLVVLLLGIAIGCLPASPGGEGGEVTGVAREALAASVWTNIPNAGLGPRAGVAIAHDVARGVTVAFGGYVIHTTNLEVLPTIPLAETREWNGQTWSAPLVHANGPKARVNAAMSYDASAKRVLLYGGRGPYDHANNRPVVYADMWSYDGKTWTKLCDPCAPGPRESHAMAFDQSRGLTMLVGGTDRYWANPGEQAYPQLGGVQTFSNGAMTSTWTWNGATWSERCPGRSCDDEPYGVGGGLVYDAKRDVMLFVGGRPFDWFCTGGYTTGDFCDSTTSPNRIPANVHEWKLVNQVWKWLSVCEVDVRSLVPSQPAPTRDCGAIWDQRFGHGVVYDAVRERVVVIGGSTRTGGPEGFGKSRGDVLELVRSETKTEWRSLCPPTNTDCGPPRRHGAGVVFEPSRRQILVAGGARSELYAIAYDDTWSLKIRGEACTSDATCNEGHCVDGVCCGVAACKTCQTCSAHGNEGVCTDIRGTEDPDSCRGNRTCANAPRNGADGSLRTCVGRIATACKDDAECESGLFCADGVCCNARCDQPCDACSAARGAPSDGTCGIARAGDVGPRPCLGRKCTGASNACEPDAPCSADKDCQDNYECRDGRCKQKVDCGQCAPYTCSPGGACKARCESVNDCAAGYACDSNHRCGALPAGSAASCSAAEVGGGGRDVGPFVFGLAVVAFARRRARERAR